MTGKPDLRTLARFHDLVTSLSTDDRRFYFSVVDMGRRNTARAYGMTPQMVARRLNRIHAELYNLHIASG